jgi:LuxR family maltose regulon positive regulatory protein
LVTAHHKDLVKSPSAFEKLGRSWCEHVGAVGLPARSDTADAHVSPGIVARRELFDLLGDAQRVTVLCAPAGSGKTSLVRSWIAEMGLDESAAWVTVEREEEDPQRFWLSVLRGLRATSAGSGAIEAITPNPELNAEAIVERLLADLTAIEDPLWLILDDLHELRSTEALRQLKLLLMRSPAELRFVLITRRDLRLGLPRLRVEGEVTEVRAEDLRFSLDDARALFAARGLRVADSALELLHERTEGWAAGLRLAALSLARHPDHDQFAAEFSGSERSVAEYLLDEVLDQLPYEVRSLLLRTSVLERVSGALADRLTGGSDGDRILTELEEAGAFVVALDPQRSWFRYHRLFADLLALELRRTASDELPGLHTAAAQWLAEHEYPVEAIRHAQAAENWGFAARLLADHWFGIFLDGDWASARELLAAFPAGAVAADPELELVAAADELTDGSPGAAEGHLQLAARGLDAVAEDRREQFEVTRTTLRLAVARARNDLTAVAQGAQELLLPAESGALMPPGLGEQLRALALMQLGIAEIWTGLTDDAEQHLEQTVALARRINRPLLELGALAHLALATYLRSMPLGEERSNQAVELARANGWSEDPFAGVAYVVLGSLNLWRGRLPEAEHWLQRATRALPGDVEVAPAAGLMLHGTRALLALVRGLGEEASAALRAEQRHDALLAGHSPPSFVHAQMLFAHVLMGDMEPAEQALASLDDVARDALHMRVVLAALYLTQDEPEAATAALAPVIDRPSRPDVDESTPPVIYLRWAIQALLLGAIGLDTLRDAGGVSHALERALDLAEPDGLILPFLFFPVRELLERHARLRTAHASLISEILDVQAGNAPAARPGQAVQLLEPLSHTELRVLRYLPTNLPAPEIASELVVSVNTIRTHTRHLYNKLGVHTRAQAVERGRVLGLLAPTPRGR